MSSIRKYTNAEWKVFGETNIDHAEEVHARSFKDRSQDSNVQEALDELKADVDTLKRNVSWLALHGGGGAGGGGSSTRRARGTITLEVSGISYSSGSSIPLRENTNIRVILERTPVNTQWTVEVALKYGAIAKKITDIIPIGSSSVTILYSQFKDFMEMDDNTEKQLTVTCSYKDQATGVTGDASWSGSLYVPNMSGSIEINTKQNIKDFLNPDVRDREQFTLDAITTIEGNFRFKLCAKEDTYKDKIDYTWEFSYSKTDPEQRKTHKDSVYKIFKSSALASLPDGTCTLYGQIYKMNGELAEFLGDTPSHTIQLLKDGINVFINGINVDNTSPESYNEVNSLYPVIQYTMAVINTSVHDVWKYKVWVHDGIASKSASGWQLVDESVGTYSYDKDPPDTIVTNIKAAIPSITGEVFSYKIEVYDRINIDDRKEVIAYCKLVASGDTFVKMQRQDSSEVVKFLEFTTENFTSSKFQRQHTLEADVDYKPTLRISMRNETSGYRPFASKSVPKIRFSNKCSGTVDDMFGSSGATLVQNKKWSASIAFKTDSYSTDEHVVFAYGQEGTVGTTTDIQSGICIKTHGVYINSAKVLDLVDDTLNVVTVVFSNTSTDWYSWSIPTEDKYTSTFVKVYLNGILSYVTTDAPFSPFSKDAFLDADNKPKMKLFIAGAAGQPCDVDIYGLKIYNAALEDINVLADYINFSIMSHAAESGLGWDYKQKDTILVRNICQQDEDGRITSSVYSSGLLSFTGIFHDASDTTKAPLCPPTEEFPATDAMKHNIDTIKQMMKLPIVLINVKSSSAGWTFQKFQQSITTDDPTDTLPDVPDAELYYWDIQNSINAIKATNVNVGAQGTSTLHDFIKNIDITLKRDEEHGTEDLLTIREDWFPENTYTLKADIVDSSHSNNAAIGSFINTFFSENNEYGFDFDEDAKATVAESKGLVPNGTIKHTVEGFPVLLFMNFQDQSGDINKIDHKLVGIYSFNLGRAALRNLGFKSMKAVLDSEKTPITTFSYPGIYKDCTVTESVPEAYWLENSQTVALKDEYVKKLKYYDSDHDIGPDAIDTQDMLFWQGHPTILNDRFEVKYHSGANSTAATVPTFTDMVQQVIKLPFEGVYTSTTSPGTVRSTFDFYGEYAENKEEKDEHGNKILTPTGNKYTTWNPSSPYDAYTSEKTDRINVDGARKYFILAMLFGLRDNFEKNMSIRYWHSADASKTKMFAIDFYDMDTALGITNQGAVTVSPTMWIKHFSNSKNEAQNYQLLIESYDSANDDIATVTQQDTTCEANWNKLWLSLDTNYIRSNAKVSLYSNEWFKLRKLMNSKLRGTDYENNFVDYFIDNFFQKQTSSCGELLFNHDYKMKYLNVFDTTNGVRNPNASAWQTDQRPNTLSKLHGRRVEYSRRWLRERVAFLDSYFFWRSARKTGTDISLIADIPDSELNGSLSFTTQTDKQEDRDYLDITTNKHNIITMSPTTSYEIGASLAVKNQPVKMFLLPPNTSSKEMSIDNVESLKTIDISPARPVLLGNNFGDLEAFELNTAKLQTGGFGITSFKTDRLRNLKFTSVTGLTYPIRLDLRPFEKLIDIDITKSTQVQEITFGDAPLATLNVNESGIIKFELANQKYVEIPDLNQCNALQTIDIKDCTYENRDDSLQHKPMVLKGMQMLTTLKLNNVESINALSVEDCQELTSIEINGCKSLSSVYVSDCPKLTGYATLGDDGVKTSGEDAIKLYNLSSLSELSLKSIDKQIGNTSDITRPVSFTATRDSLSGLTKMDLSCSSFNHINFYEGSVLSCPKFVDPDFDDAKDHGGACVFDISMCKNLREFNNSTGYTAFNLANNQHVNYLRVKNDIADPFDFDLIGRPNSRNVRFLRRVFGNLRMSSHVTDTIMHWFGNYTPTYGSFSLFGHTAPTKWNGVNTDRSKTIWDMFAKLSSFDPSKITNGYYKDGSFSDFVEGEFATNLIFSKIDKGTVGSFLGCAYSTWFDVYYVLYRIAINNKDPHKQHLISGISEIFTPNRNASSYNASANNSQLLSGTLPASLFKNLDNLTAINGKSYDGINGDQTPNWQSARPLANVAPIEVSKQGTVTLKSPTSSGESITADDGLFSCLSNLTYLRMPFDYAVADGNIFRRKSGNYKIKTLHHVFAGNDSGSQLSNYFSGSEIPANYFQNLPEVNYMETCFNFTKRGSNTLSLTKLKFPKSLVTLYRSFCQTTAALDPFAGDLDFKTMFEPGSSLTGEYASFSTSKSGNLNFYIYPGMFANVPSLQGFGQVGTSKSNSFIVKNKIIVKPGQQGSGNKTTRANEAYTESDWTNLCENLFKDTPSLQSVNNLFSFASPDYKTQPEAYQFPNGMFDQTPSLNSVHALMNDFQHPITLNGNGFANCPNLTSVSELFYQQTYDKDYGISSMIPYKFFCHGSTADTLSVSGIDTETTLNHTTYEGFKQILGNAQDLESNDSLFGLFTGCLLTQATVEALVTDASKRYPVWSQTDVNALKLPLASHQGASDANEKKCKSTIDAILAAVNTQDKWKTSILKVQTKTLSYTKYHSKIKEAYRCFRGNLNIQPYVLDVAMTPEKNDEYCPFTYQYNASTKDIKPCKKNSYQQTSIWYEDGRANTDADTYESNCRGVEALQCDEAITIPLRSGAWHTNYCSYKHTTDAYNTLNYMCAPDLFRYCAPTASVYEAFYLTGLPNWKTNSFQIGTVNERKAEWGMKGRIPPNLLRKLTQLTSLSNFLCYSKQITGYKKRDKLGNLKTYLIPPEFLSYSQKINSIAYMLYGTFIPENTELVEPLQNLYSSNGNIINAAYAFARCYWHSKATTPMQTYVGAFNGKYLSNIDYTFAVDTGKGGNENFDVGYSDSYMANYRKNIKFDENFDGATITKATATATYWQHSIVSGIRYQATASDNQPHEN